jgi:hypothetical protein
MISFKSPRRESSFDGANSRFLASHQLSVNYYLSNNPVGIDLVSNF